MTFFVQGINGYERLPLVQLFKGSGVKKSLPTAAEHALDEKDKHNADNQASSQHDVVAAYKTVNKLSQVQVIVSEEIMSSPVVTLTEQASTQHALELFRSRAIRHLPIVSAAGLLLGMVSDRDVLSALGGVTKDYKAKPKSMATDRVDQLMTSPLLTASMDTDVRYIARLFVEQRIGALPIIANDELKGIITRSDVLNAVTRHFVLDLWA